MLIKLTKTKYKEKILKTARGKEKNQNNNNNNKKQQTKEFT